MKVDPEPAELALADATRSSSGWYRANCPYCVADTGKPDKRKSLGIKPLISFFLCFKCGARGRLRDVPDAVLVAERRAQPDKPVVSPRPPEGYEPMWEDDAWESIFLGAPRRYLERRGVSREVMEMAQIGVSLEGSYAGRIIVPVLDVDHHTWLGFVGRDYTDKLKLRYRYPKGMNRGRFLYNQEALYVQTDKPVIVVEGVFDALPYWPDVIACLGKPGDYHRRLLADSEATRPISICLDGDAHEEGWALAQYLQLHGCRAGMVKLPPGKDPNSVPVAWLRDEADRSVQR